MDYLIVQVSSDEIDIHRKKAYINSLFGEISYERKLGFIDKFSKAIGFIDEFDNTPGNLLIESLYVYSEGEIFMEFYIPRKGFLTQEETNVSITHGQLANKWGKFLVKVFPELKVSIMRGSLEIDRETFILSSVFKSIEENPVTIDLSINSTMKSEELLLLESLFLDLNYKSTVRVLEYECSVCKDRDSNNPIHIEIESGDFKAWTSDEHEDTVLLVNHQKNN